MSGTFVLAMIDECRWDCESSGVFSLDFCRHLQLHRQNIVYFIEKLE
jgi:hypothetical protein